MVVLVGRSLLAGLVRGVPVVVSGVLAEDGPQVLFTVDEHPVGALGSYAAYPPLGIAIRARRPRRGLDRLHALAGGNPVEDTGELGVAVPDQETEGADPLAQVDEQVTGLPQAAATDHRAPVPVARMLPNVLLTCLK